MVDFTSKPTGGDAISTELSAEKSLNAAEGEAADVYGDARTAEELGYVHRGYASFQNRLPDPS
jgi:hypothetical protein